MGLIALDEMDLLILLETRAEECETEEERRQLRRNQQYAAKVLPIVQEHHYLLVTLLLVCCVCNESLPLFLDSLVPSWIAIMLSVSLILMFGEILPSALFTGEHGLRISATLSPLVYFAMFVLFPVAYPISSALDKSLPAHASNKYSKAEVLALLRLHVVNGTGEAPAVEEDAHAQEHDLALQEDEVRIIKGALGLRNTTVRDVLRPDRRPPLFSLSQDAVLDRALLGEIERQGHSRVPVHAEGNAKDVRGLLLTKHLAAVNPEDGRSVRSVVRREPTFVHVDATLSHVLAQLKRHQQHLAIVTNQPEVYNNRGGQDVEVDWCGVEIYGVITLLDVIENLVDDTLPENDDESEALFRRHGSSSLLLPPISTPVSVVSGGGAQLGRWASMRRHGSSRGGVASGSLPNATAATSFSFLHVPTTPSSAAITTTTPRHGQHQQPLHAPLLSSSPGYHNDSLA